MNHKLIHAVQGYYWATFLFLFLDKAFGLDIRVAGFLHLPGLKSVYYAFCFGCLGLILLKPSLAFLVGLVESSINMLVLCLGIMLPIYNLPGEVLNDGPVSQITLQAVINFLFSGCICLWSFYGKFRPPETPA